MATPSNINLNSVLNSANTGIIQSFPEPGLFRTHLIVPKGTVIPESAMVSQTAFATYVNAKLQLSTTDANKWWALTNLDDFKDETKAPATEDTGRLQLTVYTFPNRFSFRYMVGMGNFIELTKFSNAYYDCFYIDDAGNCQGAYDSVGGTNGLAAYTVQQLFVPNRGPRTTAKANQYMFTVQLADPTQMNSGFALYAAGYQADAAPGLQNAKMLDVSDIIAPAAPTTTITLTMKGGEDSYDLARAYGAAIVSAGVTFFTCTNLTVAGTVITANPASVTTGSNVVGGETIYWFKVVLSAAPTSGNIVRVAIAAPATVLALIPLFNYETLALNNTNGANCAIHTFA